MLIIEVKDGESIDQILRFWRKFQNTGTGQELRERREFTKPFGAAT